MHHVLIETYAILWRKTYGTCGKPKIGTQDIILSAVSGLKKVEKNPGMDEHREKDRLTNVPVLGIVMRNDERHLNLIADVRKNLGEVSR